MPIYTIRDNATGRQLKVSGDSPPTDEERAELFASSSPGIVAGDEAEMEAARSDNVRREMGLTDPLDRSTGLSAMDRFWASAAPPGQQEAHFKSKYGPSAKYIPLGGGDKALVRIPDGSGGHKFVLNNLDGLDAGDIAELAVLAPEIAAGALTAVAATPTPAGAIAKAAMVSGVSALAGNIVGALRDIGYRKMNDLPADLPEVLKRRGMAAGIETTFGMALPIIGSRISKVSGIRAALDAFAGEAKVAKEALRSKGINPTSIAELPDEILASRSTSLSTADAGGKVVEILNSADKGLRAAADKTYGRAASSVDSRAEALLSGATAAPVTSKTAGDAAVGGVSDFVTKSQKIVEEQYKNAYELINQEVGGGAFVRLNKVSEFAESGLNNRLRGADGKPIDLGTAMASDLKAIASAGGAPQLLEAARNLRSKLGSQIRKGDVFPGMDEGTAKALYKRLSEDISTSLASLGGKGGIALRQADENYKRLLAPFDTFDLLRGAADGGFVEGGDMVRGFAKAGPEQWGALKAILPANTYNSFRRAAAEELRGGAKVRIRGQEFSDISALGDKLGGMAPELKNELFGGEAVWRGLEQLGREQDFLVRNQGVFTGKKLPTLSQLDQFEADIAQNGFGKANAALRASMAFAQKRTDSVRGSLVSQMKEGFFSEAAKNPETAISALLSGDYGPGFVASVLRKAPATERRALQDAALRSVFEGAHDRSASLVSGKRNIYNVDQLANNVLGSERQRASARTLLGDENFKLATDWAKVALQGRIEAARGGKFAHTAARLISVLPYGKLLAARFGQEAVESAVGRKLISGLAPEYSQAFAETTLNRALGVRGAVANAAFQKAVSSPLFNDYQDMMSKYTPEQQVAIAGFLMGAEFGEDPNAPQP